MFYSPRFCRILQFFVAIYVFISTIYTVNRLVVETVTSYLPNNIHGWSIDAFQQQRKDSGPESEPFSLQHNDKTSWNISRPDGSFIGINEELFLAKAFSTSLRPSKIIPFYYRASGHFDDDDITITTLITRDRFPVFAKLVERYQGPISVTIHVKNTTSHKRDILSSLHDLYTSSPNMARYVDVHLVIDAFDRQFNTWRNVARLFARTDFVLMLDIDFVLCTDFRGAMRSSKVVMDKLREGNAAFVLPAFEYIVHSEGVDPDKFPQTKSALVSMVKAKKIDMFHASWKPGHNSTDYPRFYNASAGEVYKTTHYQAAYEPYIVFKREGPPWCDERFVGYGGNKAACLFEMYLSGISYYVLADHFIVHQNHKYEEQARKNERKFNRRIYSDFKEEACLRKVYLKAYHDNGLLNTTRGSNVQGECRKLSGISTVATQIIGS